MLRIQWGMRTINQLHFFPFLTTMFGKAGMSWYACFMNLYPSSIHPLLVVRSVYPGKKPLRKYTRYRVQIVLNLF